jgi:hypothetical protein
MTGSSRKLYTEFGVELSIRALLHPRGWIPILRAVFNALPAVMRGQRLAPSVNPRGDRLGLPADFLIASDGRVLACKYGAHANDQWSVDEVLEVARSGRECEPRRPGNMDGSLGTTDQIESVAGVYRQFQPAGA